MLFEYLSMHIAEHYIEYIRQAKTAEEEGDPDEAIQLYEKAIKQKPLLEQPYSRLMILYRKNKQYKDELRVINKALGLFMDHYDERRKSFKGNTAIARLSKAILKSVDNNSKQLENSYPEPIPKWEKRKQTVENKLN